jgi:hypothetical protein
MCPIKITCVHIYGIVSLYLYNVRILLSVSCKYADILAAKNAVRRDLRSEVNAMHKNMDTPTGHTLYSSDFLKILSFTLPETHQAEISQKLSNLLKLAKYY